MGNEKYGEQNQQPNLLAPGLSNKKKNNQGCTEKLTVKGVVSDDEQSRGRKRGSLVLLGYLRRIEETSEHFQKLKKKKETACGTRRTVTANAITLEGRD
jgi:hypothetical protein